MGKIRLTLAVFLITYLAADAGLSRRPVTAPAFAEAPEPSSQPKGYTGSVSCWECHEKFYKLWAPSRHGRAMQSFTAELGRMQLTFQKDEISVGDYHYRVQIGRDAGWVHETGPEGNQKYKIEHVLGGKNVYYFLTPMERGRLQTLPVAYDIRKKEWFDTAASGVRHFPGGPVEDEPVSWKDWPYTFNTACYRCHASQLTSNYDLETDTYHTVWAEPGINCETCHGPGDEHIRVCKEAPKGTVPKDLKITRGGRDFTVKQNNEACAPCHAKMAPITTSFSPGDRYFDHYELTTLEHHDFYPDGRDLGENYTYTLWRMSPCAKSGQLSCFHCHTSSGRYKQKKEPNKSCMPCHQERVENATEHSHHPAESPGNKCISCHMPMTEFARMRRSDHSMLPPTPAATIQFKSPNACSLCHTDNDPAWADQWVRKWRDRDYQAPVLHRAGLIDAARNRDWTRLPEMLAYITSKDRDEVYATSLIRLLQACDDPYKWPAILEAMKDPSPLVRSAAAASLGMFPSKETGKALLEATGDDYRLVRIRAASALASYPRFFAPILLEDKDRQNLDKATGEYLTSLTSRPDHWTSYYNLGNYYLQRGELPIALAAYETSLKLEPRAVMSLVNASIAYIRMGENSKAEESLRKALEIEPNSAAANFNMGLLKAEEKDLASAEKHLRAALEADPKMAEAAYNLGVLVANERPKEAIELCLKAFNLRPNPKYGYTLAFYMRENGNPGGAAEALKLVIELWPAYADAYLLLGDIYEKEEKTEDAKALYRHALDGEALSRRDKLRIEMKLRALPPPETRK
ncbi:MAG: tetratricopeptide repeat protein [Proteobacteria bacterium]|nr:tetratricopeptide repeat protein [Pseudomonadota bacterium]NIS69121.1 tetratricopeptide repeat protein [Pseudomonadota bacterium]